MGAEFAPFHLHAMPEVARLPGLDAVLAGSYGDSVGRAEFSGVRVQRLGPTVPSRVDPFALVKAGVARTVHAGMLEDCCGYRRHLHRDSEYQYREIEQQMHYMRRRNQSPMACIHEHIPLFQLFTAPETFGLMWSLDPALRDDRFYTALLPTLPGRIGELPWARTGVPLGVGAAEPDRITKGHHRYGTWLRNELRAFIVASAQGDAVRRLGIFDEAALERTVEIWARAKTVTTSRIDELMAWLAALSIFVETCQIRPLQQTTSEPRAPMRALLGGMRASAYLAARDWLRR
jgi:asparagine synthase (glutamine-hydrolysing)